MCMLCHVEPMDEFYLVQVRAYLIDATDKSETAIRHNVSIPDEVWGRIREIILELA